MRSWVVIVSHLRDDDEFFELESNGKRESENEERTGSGKVPKGAVIFGTLLSPRPAGGIGEA
jgi:hypothetical protein